VKITWSTESRKALRSIRRYIGQDSEFYAQRFVARIVERVERAAQAPTQGHRVHEYPERPLKEVHVAPYRIIYSFAEDELRVVTIVHFAQQLPERLLE
jgi:plasmid stabilization system protein ParE